VLVRKRADAIVAESELRERITEERDKREKKMPIFSPLRWTLDSSQKTRGLLFYFF